MTDSGATTGNNVRDQEIGSVTGVLLELEADTAVLRVFVRELPVAIRRWKSVQVWLSCFCPDALYLYHRPDLFLLTRFRCAEPREQKVGKVHGSAFGCDQRRLTSTTITLATLYFATQSFQFSSHLVDVSALCEREDEFVTATNCTLCCVRCSCSEMTQYNAAWSVPVSESISMHLS